MQTISKKTLVRDFEAGRLAIKWDSIESKAVAVYLTGEVFTIRFDTYLSVKYPNSSSPCPKGFAFLAKWTFWNMETAKAFRSVFPEIKIKGEPYIWGVRSVLGGVEMNKRFQTREQAERGAWEHPLYHIGTFKFEVFNTETGEVYRIN